jgi:hypothetical protein
MVDGKRVPEGECISGYFPQVVKPSVFHAVKKKLDDNRGKGGRTGKAHNLFRNIAVCAYCGGTMQYVAKGPKWIYLVCDNGKRKVKCHRHSMRYVENCHKLRPEQVLPDPNKQAKVCQSLRQRIQGCDGELAAIDRQLDNLIDQVTKTNSPSIRDRYEVKLKELESRKEGIEKQKTADERELARAEKGLESFTAWKANLDQLRIALKKDDPQLRLQLRSHLGELIERIEVFSAGHRKEHDPEAEHAAIQKVRALPDGRLLDRFELLDHPLVAAARDGDKLMDDLVANASEFSPVLLKKKVFWAFLNDLGRRRMTKEGRFVRLHFKTGSRVDIVPTGSFASGHRLVRPSGGRSGWSAVSPDIDRMLKTFSETYRN